MHRFRTVALAAAAAALVAVPAAAAPHTTVDRTYQDRDGDLRLEPSEGDDYEVVGESEDFRPPRRGSIVNFLQLSDFQMVDEESPGRFEFLDTSQRVPPFNVFSAAYRPQEALTTQITEAMVRQARNTTSEVTGETLDLTVLTGDNADSQQYNETRWFIDILDGTAGPPGPSSDPATSETSGRKIDPDSGREGGACDTSPDTQYDGVQGGGKTGFYDPDRSDAGSDTSDGDGYSPEREDNGGADEYPNREPADPGTAVSSRDFPNLLEDAQDPFEAVGLDMPWYTAFGNHDALIQGNGSEAYNGPREGTNLETANEEIQDFVKGCAKPSKAPSGFLPPDESTDATRLFTDPTLLDQSSPLTVPPDERRCYLAKDEKVVRPKPGTDPCQTGWIQEHFQTTGEPAGHGFAPTASLDEDSQQAGLGRPARAEANNDGYYSFSPRPNLRYIVLDSVTDECGASICAEGSIDNTQFGWLREQIETANGMGQYVLVFSHHSLRTTRQPSTDASEAPLHYGERVDRDNPLNPQNPSGADTLEELFCQNANVLAHVAGHEHENEVRDHRCVREERSPTPGPGRFIEVTTAAHIDYPQQSRMIELVDNGNGTISLVLTLLDHAGPAEPGGAKADPTAQGEAGEQPVRLASIGRELAYNDPQGSRGARGGDEDDTNAIFVLERPFADPPGDRPGPGRR